jgi:hypothetical protein
MLSGVQESSDFVILRQSLYKYKEEILQMVHYYLHPKSNKKSHLLPHLIVSSQKNDQQVKKCFG